MTVWDWVQGFGALVGLATGAYILRDRWFKHYPIAIIISKPIFEPGGDAFSKLRLTNPSDRPMLVSWEMGMRNGLFSIAKDDALKNIIISALPGTATIVLDAGETRELELMRPDNIGDIDDDNRIECELMWWFAQPILWQRSRRLRVGMRKRDYLLLAPGEGS